MDSFRADITCSPLYTEPAEDVDDFADQLDLVTTDILDCHCPLTERKRFESTRRDTRWLSTEAVDLKRQRRRLERKWRSTRLPDDYIAYRKSCCATYRAIVASRGSFYYDRIKSAAADPRRRDVLHLTENLQFRSDVECSRLFCTFL